MSETSNNVINPNAIYNRHHLAELLAVSTKTVDRQVIAGELPPPFSQGRFPLWRGKALLDWFDRKQNTAIKEAGGLRHA